LGVVSLGAGTSFVIADIPGLIEGAHEGVGLGHKFLRHVERTRLLVHVVDVASIEGRDPIKDFEIINEELQKYNPVLASKQQIVAANKTDIPGAMDNYKSFSEELEKRGYKVFPISAATNKGLSELLYYIAEKLKDIPETVIIDESEEEVVYTAGEEKPFEIRIEDGKYIIEGTWFKRLVDSTNFSNYESLQYFQRAIKNKGVIDELERMGINEGDTVNVYGLEFDYVR
jgi:GTP-binding protein